MTASGALRDPLTTSGPSSSRNAAPTRFSLFKVAILHKQRFVGQDLRRNRPLPLHSFHDTLHSQHATNLSGSGSILPNLPLVSPVPIKATEHSAQHSWTLHGVTVKPPQHLGLSLARRLTLPSISLACLRHPLARSYA